MGDDVSRRDVLASGGTLLAGRSLVSPRAADETREPATTGWVTKGDRTDVGDRNGLVEAREHLGTSLCNDGPVYRCRTCSGVTFYLLVSIGSSRLTVGNHYRFRPTGKRSICGNFQVRLFDAGPCDGSSTTSQGSLVESSTETTGTTPTTDARDSAERTPTETTTSAAPERTTTAETTTATTTNTETTTTATTTDTGTTTTAETTTATTTDTETTTSETTTTDTSRSTPELEPPTTNRPLD